MSHSKSTAGCSRGRSAMLIGLYGEMAARQAACWHDDLSLWQRPAAMTEDNQKVEIGLAGALHRANRSGRSD